MKNSIYLIAGILGIIGGILMIVAGFTGDSFPGYLWLVASFCLLFNAAAQIINYRNLKKNKDQ